MVSFVWFLSTYFNVVFLIALLTEKDEMFKYTDIKQAPWYVVRADDKKLARLNCISHLLSIIPYEDLTPKPFELPPRKEHDNYMRPPITDQNFVPEKY